MPRNGAHTVSDLPPGLTEIECPKCGRRGRYKRETLVSRFGPDQTLPAMLTAVAACRKARDMADICGVRFSRTPWERRKRED